MKFLCSGCGACCMMAGGYFGLPDRGDGACANLTQDNQCSIYETRPDVCRVDKLYELVKKDITKKQLYIENTKACHQLIDAFKLDKSYKINLKEYERK
tara:strand:- start:238 stop:531 length:294 start_codon:yes stop_codon:yes gene_type:complete